MIYFFEILGEPMGKQRPKFASRGKYVQAYTPQKTVNYETLVKTSFQIAYSDSKPIEKDVPLDVEITAFYGIPKSTSKKKTEKMLERILRPTKKPDTDNIAKIVLDSLNGIAFYDDAQVVSLNVKKFYSDEPRVCVTISKLGIQDARLSLF